VRIACLFVRDVVLAAELRARPEERGLALAIASGPGPRAEIFSVSPEAARRGVRPFRSVANARALCAELCVRVASPALERAAREALLDAALACSPRAAPAPRGAGVHAAEASVFLDASGVGTLFGSEAGFAAALAARALALGLPAVVAVAASRGVAHVAARAARPEEVCVIPAGAEPAFLAPLPVDLLAPEDALAESLTRFGIRRIGELARLPPAALAARLGAAALALLARARGEEEPLPLPVHAETRLCEAIDLEYALDRLEPLGFVLRGLLSRLAARLGARGLVCGELELELGLEGGGRDARRIGVAAPTRDERALLGLLRLALETQPPCAPVEAAALATRGVPARADQLDLFRPAGPAPEVLGRTLAKLEALCGEGRVGVPAVAADHHPDAFGLGAFSATSREPEPRQADREEPPLALRALRPPAPAQVREQAGRPTWLRSAVANGPVLRVAGPWRTSGNWWSEERCFAYDSYDVHTGDGSVVRLRRDLLRRTWEIDGIYD
jgi:protein ImuB